MRLLTGRPAPYDGAMSRVAVIAFSGWNDAGDASSAAITHLTDQWSARELATIDAEEYVDFHVSRPELYLDEASRVRIQWPSTTVSLLTSPQGRELVVVQGPEPSHRWKRFCEEVLDALEVADVNAVVVLGALLADVPHSRPLPVRATVEPGMYEAASSDRYQGPVGIPTILARAAVTRGWRTTSIWVQIPHYVAQSPSPKGTLALIRELESALPMTIDRRELEEDAEAWTRGVDELARTDSDIADYVRRLERAQDAVGIPGADGDAIAREFEQFLRRRDDES